MRIQGVGGVRIEAARRRPRETSSQSRALTTVAPVPQRDAAAFGAFLRPDAAVVVQLLAMRDGLPQTRERRRADPAVASAAYAARLSARRPGPAPTVDLVA